MSPALVKMFSDLKASDVMSGMFDYPGAEQDEVFAAMRERGMKWTMIDTGVGGNAGYRVHWYLQARKETQPDLISGRLENIKSAHGTLTISALMVLPPALSTGRLPSK